MEPNTNKLGIDNLLPRMDFLADMGLDNNDQAHKDKAGSSRQHMCAVCSKFFDSEKAMLEHVSMHSSGNRELGEGRGNDNVKNNARVHECPQCKVLFNCTFDLNLHLSGHKQSVIMVHKKNAPGAQTGFECCVCGKVVGTRGNLVKHMFLHNGLKPYQCEVCGKAFSIKGNRDKHMLTHTEQKPHQCHICDKKFTLKGNLQQHILTHTKQKFYKCTVCAKEFTLKGNLLKHLKRHESGLKVSKTTEFRDVSHGNTREDNEQTTETSSKNTGTSVPEHRPFEAGMIQNSDLWRLSSAAIRLAQEYERLNHEAGQSTSSAQPDGSSASRMNMVGGQNEAGRIWNEPESRARLDEERYKEIQKSLMEKEFP